MDYLFSIEGEEMIDNMRPTAVYWGQDDCSRSDSNWLVVATNKQFETPSADLSELNNKESNPKVTK